MTFTEIVGVVTDYCNLTSSEATTRIGKAVNRHYRRITSQLGMDAARFVTRSVSMSVGVRTVTFTEIEKIDRVLDTTDSTAIRLLQEISVHDQRSAQPGTGQPTTWAFQNSDADSVVILTDTLPQTAYSLQADGWTTLSALSGSDEPVFPESYHDILAWYVIAEELLKKEKTQLAREYERRADGLLADLQMFFADSHTKDSRQGGGAAQTLGGSGGGSSATVGGTAYTQSALLTFDRGAATAPFAVAQADAPYVPNLGAEFLGNITTDRLIGRDTAATGESEQLTVGGGLEFTGSGGIQRSALTGDVTASAGSAATTIANDAVTTAKILAANVTYAKIQDVSAASRLLGRGSAAGSGDVEELTVGTGLLLSGTVLSAATGLAIAASVATNALTVSLTTADGTSPAAATPVSLQFRDATVATGALTTISVTAATTLTVPDTATLGASNSVPFRAWVVAFNDAGTVRLGIINCANATSIYPLSGWGIASSTAISTGADSAQVFYTGSAVTSKAYIVLGYVSYESGLATAGTYASAPTRVQGMTQDVTLPGRPVQVVSANYTTQQASSSSAFADTGLTASITPTSAANRVLARSITSGTYKDNGAAAQAIGLKLLRGATQLGYQHSLNTGAAAIATAGSMNFEVLDAPATTSATIYKVQFAAEANAATVYVQEGSSQSAITLTELMA